MAADADPQAKRVMMLAIDSMSLPFARQHLNRLPTFKRLMTTGRVRQLASTAETMSASVWPTFAMGAEPGLHGRYFPFQWDPATMSFRRAAKPVWSGRFDYDPFWFDLARDGIDCIALDPVDLAISSEAPCLQICNWSCQSSGAAFSSDPAILSKLRWRFGRRPIGAEVPVPKTRRQCRTIRNRMIKALRAKTNALLWLSKNRNWQFFLAAYCELHRAGHNLWPVDAEFASDSDPDALLSVYKEMDRQLGRLIKSTALEDTLFVIFAIHGMDANRAQDYFLPEIMNRLNNVYVDGAAPEQTTNVNANLFSMLRNTLPSGLQYAAVQALGEDIQDWVVNRSFVGGLDWPKTPAFPVASGGEGYIRLNIKGRERDGFFDPDSPTLAKYVDWLTNELSQIRVKETHEPLVKKITFLQSEFPGPCADMLPDLLLDWAPAAPVETIESRTIGAINASLNTGRGGNHTGDAFAIVFGPGAEDCPLSEIAHIRDLHKLARMPAFA